MGFKFDKYSADELQSCGAAFKADVDTVAALLNNDTEGWTEFVLDWFADTSNGRRVNARKARWSGCDTLQESPGRPAGWPPKRQTPREWGLDLDHSEFPAGDTKTLSAWATALKPKGSCRIRLALESEFGKRRSGPTTTVMILEDAVKLARTLATAKVMVFSSCQDGQRLEVYDYLDRLRAATDDKAPWLCIDLPWYNNLAGVYVTDFKVLR